MAGLTSGDERSWEELFRRLWPVALRAALRPELRLSPEDAEEAASDALSQLGECIGLVTDAGQLPALAATIAYRRAVSLSRRKHAGKRTAPAEDPLAGPPAFPDTLSDLELAELARLLHVAMARLDDGTQMLIADRATHGLTNAELSAKHQIPLGTACARIARGLAKIRDRLRENPSLMQALKDYLR